MTDETVAPIYMPKPLVIWPDARLKLMCAEVTTIDAEVKQFANDLFATMLVNHGYGISAPQVGDFRRIIVVTVNRKPTIMINPKIVDTQSETRNFEGCLSVPGFRTLMTRAEKVVVDYLTVDGVAETLDTATLDYYTNYLTPACIQHEIDHLNGVLFTDGLSELKLSRAKKAVKSYRKALTRPR